MLKYITLYHDVLQYFDVNKVTLQCDISQSGLGVVLQDDKPVEFATEQSSQSSDRKEASRSVFGMERMHTYVYGRKVRKS